MSLLRCIFPHPAVSTMNNKAAPSDRAFNEAGDNR